MHIDIHDNAELDLEKLWDDNPEAAAYLQSAIEILEDDPYVIDKLTTRGNSEGDPTLNIKPWESAYRSGGLDRNLWRFRYFDSPATSFRVVYGYHWQTRQICILAIAHKDELNYDNHDNPLVKRIFNDWAAYT